MLELVLKDGMVVDGKNKKRFIADIGIKNGRIALIGKNLSGKKELGAEGKIVSPGFIDMHSHSDVSIVVKKRFDSKLKQGITTEVTGQCGLSVYPVKNAKTREYLEKWAIEGKINSNSLKNFLHLKGLPCNVAPFAGHGNLRATYLGFENRAPSKTELAKMKDLLAAVLKEKVFGLSSGLIYPPGCYSKTGELVELVKVARDFNCLYTSHIRGEGVTLLKSISELIETGQSAKARVHISHIKCAAPSVLGKSKQVIKMIDTAYAKGLSITADQYPYTASSTVLSVFLPLWASEGGKVVERLKDPVTRRNIEKEMIDSNLFIDGSVFKGVFIAGGNNKSIIGKSLSELAKKMKKPEFDVMFDIITEDPLTTMVSHSMIESDLINFIKYERVCIGSDSLCCLTDKDRGARPHPRSFGTFPRVLNRYVKLKKALTLEEAVYKMTGLPAHIVGLNDRGVLEEGKIADLVVFDENKIKDTATFEEPVSYPRGIDYVIIGGRIAVCRNEVRGYFGSVLKKE